MPDYAIHFRHNSVLRIIIILFNVKLESNTCLWFKQHCYDGCKSIWFQSA